MIEVNLILLLQLVHVKGDVNELLRRGLTFSQISDLLGQAVNEGLVIEEAGVVTLTEDGVKEVERLRRTGEWIQPKDNMRVDKMSEDEIYLPAEKDSFFESR